MVIELTSDHTFAFRICPACWGSGMADRRTSEVKCLLCGGNGYLQEASTQIRIFDLGCASSVNGMNI